LIKKIIICVYNILPTKKYLGQRKYSIPSLKTCQPNFTPYHIYSFYNAIFSSTSHLHGKLASPFYFIKKGNPLILPITGHLLAKIIYKLFTIILTTILIAYKEQYQILHDNQEGFWAKRNIARQLQRLSIALKDAKFTNQDIYILYIDFKNAFGSIDHTRLLTIMKDLGYPQDIVQLIGNFYLQSTTRVTKEYSRCTWTHSNSIRYHSGRYTKPIFIEPLLRWLH
jgi:hypothetical protein